MGPGGRALGLGPLCGVQGRCPESSQGHPGDGPLSWAPPFPQPPSTSLLASLASPRGVWAAGEDVACRTEHKQTSTTAP